MSENLKEIIGRTTMVVVALVLAWAATTILRATMNEAYLDSGGSPWIWFIAIVLYVLAFALACFVFASRDPRKANLARVMSWSDRISSGLQGLARLLFDDSLL